MSTNNKAIKKFEKPEEEIDFDMCEVEEDELDAIDIAQVALENANLQMMRAIELTKLAVDKNPTAMNEDEVFATFRKAFLVINELNPIESILRNFNMEEDHS